MQRKGLPEIGNDAKDGGVWSLWKIEKVCLSESVREGWDHAETANPSHCPPSVPASQRDTHQWWWRHFRPRTQSQRQESGIQPPTINTGTPNHIGWQRERTEMTETTTCMQLAAKTDNGPGQFDLQISIETLFCTFGKILPYYKKGPPNPILVSKL